MRRSRSAAEAEESRRRRGENSRRLHELLERLLALFEAGEEGEGEGGRE